MTSATHRTNNTNNNSTMLKLPHTQSHVHSHLRTFWAVEYFASSTEHIVCLSCLLLSSLRLFWFSSHSYFMLLWSLHWSYNYCINRGVKKCTIVCMCMGRCECIQKPNQNTNVDLCVDSKVVRLASCSMVSYVWTFVLVYEPKNLCVVWFDVYYSQVMRCDLSSVEVET